MKAFLATPNVNPAAVPLMCVPWPLQSVAGGSPSSEKPWPILLLLPSAVRNSTC